MGLCSSAPVDEAAAGPKPVSKQSRCGAWRPPQGARSVGGRRQQAARRRKGSCSSAAAAAALSPLGGKQLPLPPSIHWLVPRHAPPLLPHSQPVAAVVRQQRQRCSSQPPVQQLPQGARRSAGLLALRVCPPFLAPPAVPDGPALSSCCSCRRCRRLRSWASRSVQRRQRRRRGTSSRSGSRMPSRCDAPALHDPLAGWPALLWLALQAPWPVAASAAAFAAACESCTNRRTRPPARPPLAGQGRPRGPAPRHAHPPAAALWVDEGGL